MFRRCTASCVSLILVGLLAWLGAAALSASDAPRGRQQQQQPPQGQQTPAFRSGIVLVPIDVRVLDRNTGKPVMDLKREDFTLLEDDRPVQISHFEVHALKADAEPPKPGTRPAIREAALTIVPQSNRIFLFMLGRGRLQEPSKGIDSLIQFVRHQLLPQDQVAVFAYDRATDFTTDHEQVAKLIERFRDAHYELDMEVTNHTSSGLAAVYGSKALPKQVRAKIDAVFQGSGLLAHRELGRGETAATKRAEGDSRAAIDALQRQDQKLAADRLNEQLIKDAGAEMAQPGMLWTSADEIAASAFTDMTLDDFMANNAQTLMDLGNCYAGIEYLRHLEGEKHMVFVTEKGMYLPRVEDDAALAQAANDARVAIDTFQTGGIEGQRGGQPQNMWSETFAFKALRNIAEWTGGVSAIGERGDNVMARLNAATLNDYLLGYYPSLSRFDGGYRKITVKVNRPDVTVLYRHGYYARRDVGSFDRRTFITRDRIQAAAGFSRELKDIKIKMDASLKKVGDVHQLQVNAFIDPAALSFKIENGVHIGSIDIAMLFADQKGQMMGQHYQRADLKLTEEVWQKIQKTGIPYGASIEINPGVRNVRLIVYDYRNDVVGSSDKRVW